MKEQWKLLKAIRGQHGGGLYVSDENKKARQAGWRGWAMHNWSDQSSQLFEPQLPLIQNEFTELLGSFGRTELKDQIRYLLVVSNLVDDDDIIAETSPESPLKRQRVENITIGEHGETAISPEGEGIEVDAEGMEVDEEVESSSAWSLAEVSSMNLQTLASFEFVLQTVIERKKGDDEVTDQLCREHVVDLLRLEGLDALDFLVIDWLVAMTSFHVPWVQKRLERRRTILLQDQLFRPKAGETLAEYLKQLDRLNNGERLPEYNHSSFKQNDNGQLSLTDSAVESLRYVQNCFHIPISRLPSLITVFNVFFYGRPMETEKIPAVSTLQYRFTRNHEIDLLLLARRFKQTTAKFDRYGNRILFFSSDDDSEHINRKIHVLLVTYYGENGLPCFYLLSMHRAVSGDSEGNASLNLKSMQNVFPPSSLAHYGGGTTDNASDARACTRKTFQKIMSLLPPEDRLSNGVERKPIEFGDPFHIANLVVSNASLAAWGPTKRNVHNQVHHRQMLQSLYDGVNKNRGIARMVEEEIAKEFGIDVIRVKIKRERQQRWMINQLQAKHVMELYNHKVGGYPFLVLFCTRLAKRLGKNYRSDALLHAAKLLQMPAIRAALNFEMETGEYFQPIMTWHSRSGILGGRPGFRMLEILDLFLHFELPWWKTAMANPASQFPETFKSLAEIGDPKLRAKKEEQVKTGIQTGYEVLVKHSYYYFLPSLIFLFLSQAKEGPSFARALLTCLVIDSTIVLMNGDETYVELLKIELGDVKLWFRSHGLGKSEALGEIKELAMQAPVERNLLQFKVKYPAVFTTLESAFGAMASNSRLDEQTHGGARSFATKKNASISDERLFEQRAYMTETEYNFRVERRAQAKARVPDRSIKSRSVKHEGSKEEVELQSRQVFERSKIFLADNLGSLLTKEQLESVQIQKIRDRGVLKDERERLVAANDRLRVREQSRRSKPATVEDLLEEAQGMEVDNDEDWRDFAQQMEDTRYKELGTVTFWDKLDGDNLRDYYQKVLIGIETAENGKKGKPTKGTIMKTVKQFLARHKEEKNDPSEYIDITEAIQLESPDEEGGTHSAKRRDATRAFFSHKSRRSEVDPHYLYNPGEG